MMTGFNKVQIFTVEVGGRPTLVFDAGSAEEAAGICALPEFRADLAELTSGGAPVCEPQQSLVARYADVEEIAAFERGANAQSSDGPTMVFLIKVDGVVVTVVDPG